MRNAETWRPTRLVKDKRSGAFLLNRKLTFGGSLYIAEIQRKAYVPLMQAHLHGVLLDIGCGPVPYYEVYRDSASEIVCIDYPGTIHGKEHIDHEVDLNTQRTLPYPDGYFDSILASDMLPHMTRPDLFMAEIARLLKPGGKAMVSSTFINWIGEFPYEYSHQTGPGLRVLAEDAGLKVIHLESFGGHADVLMDTLNKFLPSGMGNRLFLLFARIVNWTGWPERNRKRTKDRYSLGNAMIVQKP
jgi:SAM-dependent methyltransferase